MTCIEEIRNNYVVYFVCVVVTELCIVPMFVLNVLHEAQYKDDRLVLLCLLYIVVIDFVVNYAYLNSGKFTYSLWCPI